MTRLAGYTTLGLGGPARSFVAASTESELIDAVAAADAAAGPVLLIGGGSNLVIADDGFPGTVIHLNARGVSYAEAGDGCADVTVAATTSSQSSPAGRAPRRYRTLARTAKRWLRSSPPCGSSTG